MTCATLTRAADGALIDDVTIPQAGVWNRAWDIIGPEGGTLPIDSGWSLRAQIRPTATSSILLFEWNTTPTTGIGEATLAGNTARIDLTGTESELWEWFAGVYNVYLIGPGGDRIRIVQGCVRIDPSVVHF